MEKSMCIVLRTADYRDNDKMLTLFSRETGKLDVLSRGCKKTTSSLLACSELFTCGLYSYYNRQGKYYISQCEIFDSFYALRQDVERFSVAAVLAEACEKAINHDEQNSRLFSLAAHSFNALKECQPLSVLVFFLIKFVDICGYRPNIYTCLECGIKIKNTVNYFSIQDGGLYCRQCASKIKNTIPVSVEALKIIHQVYNLPAKAVLDFTKDTELLSELKDIFLKYLVDKLENQMASVKFLSRVL